jgi:hypothetical protein
MGERFAKLAFTANDPFTAWQRFVRRVRRSVRGVSQQ